PATQIKRPGDARKLQRDPRRHHGTTSKAKGGASAQPAHRRSRQEGRRNEIEPQIRPALGCRRDHGYGKGEGQLSRDTFPAPIRDQLQNGIRTLLTPFDERRRASVVLYLKTGSRFESPSENGLSHFLEHMLFRGTEEHPSAHALSTAFEDLGGSLEATTAADHGTLEINVPQEHQIGRASWR